MENNDINKWIKLSIIAGIVLISFSIFYYFVIFLPQKDKEKNKQEFLKDYINRLGLDGCLKIADEIYTGDWDTNCKSLGEKEHCGLPIYLSDRINESHRKQREECYKRYPVR